MCIYFLTYTSTVNPLPDHGSLEEATQAEEDEVEVELLLDIDMDAAPVDGDMLVETPSIAVVSPQEKVVDEFRSEVRHHWVAGAIPKHVMRFGRRKSYSIHTLSKC